MLLLRESHCVTGRHEDAFEDLIRDEWIGNLAKTDDVRLLYFLKVAHGSGDSYNVITYTAFQNGSAWDALMRRIDGGNLSSLMERIDELRHEVQGKFLVPLPWSPLRSFDLETIPTGAQEHENTLFMEDTVHPYEGKLSEYIERSGTMYAKEFEKPAAEKSRQLLDIQASFRTAYGSHQRREIILWQRVLQPKGLLALLTHEMPRKYKQPGLWMHDALELRDRWKSVLLRSAAWSPLY